MKEALFTLWFLAASAGAAGAVDLTLQRISSIAPIPVGHVTKEEMAPPPGVTATPIKERPAYEVVGARQAETGSLPRTVPVPVFNPVSVSFCLSDSR
ncbi:hypothetical protein OIU34_24930 [Pararhizobium sp. BT-229]|uniref:hypothetical protein n=1 Tax=Pararhizobium sp. BT-229 TaxID=2986923 RepID=UPI0021F74533|nr:hypothetical protein [Pararhizobium sp. BT-229]MCV9965127.1 hypothetical protein [Pararhizobium sp. BT-229]